MFCQKCGAAVSGNYCCCCGARILDAASQFKKDMRTKKHDFVYAVQSPLGVAIARHCWEIADSVVWWHNRPFLDSQRLRPGAYEDLESLNKLAASLYVNTMLVLDARKRR